MSSCLLGLGSNVGDRARSLSDALERLKRYPGIELLRQSGFRETAPAGGPTGQDAYLNAAALVRALLSPQELLQACQEIENELGRGRGERWGPRTIDIDLLLYDYLVLNSPELQIPHPRMAWRRFVLEPAAEIAAEMIHPTIGWTIARLLEHLNTTPWYLALAGTMGSDRRTLAVGVAERLGARLLSDQFEPAMPEAFCSDRYSRAWQVALELLEARARLLDRQQPDWSEERPTISDFWFEQPPALVRIWPFAKRRPEYKERWREASLRIVRPRLVAIMHAPLEKWLAHLRSVQGRPIKARQLQLLAEALENRVSAADGPVLRLDASDHETALVELTAAVEAMR